MCTFWLFSVYSLGRTKDKKLDQRPGPDIFYNKKGRPEVVALIMGLDGYFYPQSRQSSPVVWIGTPHPSFVSGGGGAHTLAGAGGGGSQLDEGTYTAVL